MNSRVGVQKQNLRSLLGAMKSFQNCMSTTATAGKLEPLRTPPIFSRVSRKDIRGGISIPTSTVCRKTLAKEDPTNAWWIAQGACAPSKVCNLGYPASLSKLETYPVRNPKFLPWQQ